VEGDCLVVRGNLLEFPVWDESLLFGTGYPPPPYGVQNLETIGLSSATMR
jgi:hypothetical protein